MSPSSSAKDRASPTDFATLSAVAHRLADVAAAETLRHFRRPGLAIDSKAAGGGFDPVTEADRAAERAMRACLAEMRPGDGVLGEEYAATGGTSGVTWVLDPIDGTRAYMAGAPTWGTLIAVRGAGGILHGLIDQPHIGERFEGGAGTARLVRGGRETPLSTRAAGGLAEAVLLTTFPEIGTVAERDAFARVAERVRLVRYGLDCYAYALLAAGHVDLVIEAGLHPHDIAAPIAVIEAAGGVVTDWRGGPAADGGRVVAAGSRAVHAAALEVLRQAV